MDKTLEDYINDPNIRSLEKSKNEIGSKYQEEFLSMYFSSEMYLAERKLSNSLRKSIKDYHSDFEDNAIRGIVDDSLLYLFALMREKYFSSRMTGRKKGKAFEKAISPLIELVEADTEGNLIDYVKPGINFRFANDSFYYTLQDSINRYAQALASTKSK